MKKVTSFNNYEQILVNYIFLLYMIYQVVEILIWYCTRLLPKRDMLRREETLEIT